MCIYTMVEGVFVLQATTQMILFKPGSANMSTPMMPVFFNSKDARIITKQFVRTAVCLVFDGTKIQFSGTGSTSSLSLSIPITPNRSNYPAVNLQQSFTFHAVTRGRFKVGLLKPLVTLECKLIQITCEIDTKSKRLFMTFRTSSASKSKIVGTYRFSGMLLPQTMGNAKPDSMGVDISLYNLDMTNMYECSMATKTDQPSITLHRGYADAKQQQTLVKVFSETYAMGLLKTMIKGMTIKRNIYLIVTKERALLMTINEYKGCIQVAQRPYVPPKIVQHKKSKQPKQPKQSKQPKQPKQPKKAKV